MTEQEWLGSVNTEDLVKLFASNPSPRKFRLFSVACCLRAWDSAEHVPEERELVAVDIAEKYAEGVVDFEVRREAIRTINKLGKFDGPGQLACAILRVGTLALATGTLACVRAFSAAMVKDYAVEERHQAVLFRDIVGNPFQPVEFDPAWRTTTVVSIAKTMYDSRDFSPMPMLADALQDAGCEHADILNHCRSKGPHVRGCWVVDLVLGKE